MLNIKDLRKEYRLKSLELKELQKDPFEQFFIWFEEAKASQIPEANSMILATAAINAKPSSRVLLLKKVDSKGFIFFTNYESRKGRELLENPFASLTFYWKELERQVNVEGKVEKISEKESEEYFTARPRGSQIGAWASSQSSSIPSRAFLEEKFKYWKEKFAGQLVPKPPFWGGFRLLPERFEFWQGRPNRLHDRFQYVKAGKDWKIARLCP
jgi:pyridoxamine 5'-phosphate oxidase